MPGVTQAARSVCRVLKANPGVEASRLSGGGCICWHGGTPGHQSWGGVGARRRKAKGHATLGLQQKLEAAAPRSKGSARKGFRVSCAAFSGWESSPVGPVAGMKGHPLYRRPSLERGLLPSDDLSRVEALYIADAEAAPERAGAIPWQPVLLNVLTACLASFLFGYHVGVVNGPLEYMAVDLGFAGSNVVKGTVVSSTLAGAFLGSLGGGTMAEQFGRRRTFQLNALPLLVGAAISAAAQTVSAMVAGRFIVGLGLGIATAVLPLYISEIAPAAQRGTMGSLNQLSGCAGILAALLLSLPLRSNPGWWRTMFWIACLPAAALAAGMAGAAESPRWLFQRGRFQETERTLARLWGPNAVSGAMADLKGAQQGGNQEATWKDLVAPRYIRVVAIGCAMFALQQLSGINAIFYFSSTVFRNAGVQSQFLANAGLGVVNFVGALLALVLMDRWGRRKALRWSYLGMAASLLASSAAMTLSVLRPWSGPLSVIATLAFVLAFCLGAGPVPALLLPEMFPTRIRSRALALCMACHWVFNFGIGLWFLEVVRMVGLPGVYACFAAVALATVAFTQRFVVETQGKSLEEIERMLAAAH